MTGAVGGGPGQADDTDVAQRGFLEERQGPILRLTLDRPQRCNALTVELVAGLADRIAAVRDERDGSDPVRVIVLSGASPVFCAGGDLTDLSEVASHGPAAVTDVVYRHFQRLVAELLGSPVPVLAEIDGAALGAGLDLALACDLRVATTRSTFASSWIGVGLVPGMGGAHLLTHAIGATRAREMVLLGEAISAQTALEWGLLNRVAAPEDLGATVDALAQRLASLPAVALDRSKASLSRVVTPGLNTELATLGSVQGALLTSSDFQERTARFR